MNIKQLREITGLTQQKFGERFKIPLRSVQNWESGQRQPPEYLPRLIELVIILENEIDQLRSGQTCFDTETKQNPQQQQPPEKEKDTQRVQETKNEKEIIKKLIKECDIEPKTSSFCKYKPEKGGCAKCTKPEYEECNIKVWEGYEELERMINE